MNDKGFNEDGERSSSLPPEDSAARSGAAEGEFVWLNFRDEHGRMFRVRRDFYEAFLDSCRRGILNESELFVRLALLLSTTQGV